MNKNKQKKDKIAKKQETKKKVAVLLIIAAVLVCAGGGYYLYQENKGQEAAAKEAEEKEKEQMALSKQNTDKDTVNIDAISEYLQGLENIELLSTDLSDEEDSAEVSQTASAVSDDASRSEK